VLASAVGVGVCTPETTVRPTLVRRSVVEGLTFELHSFLLAFLDSGDPLSFFISLRTARSPYESVFDGSDKLVSLELAEEELGRLSLVVDCSERR
jgi:hypothetical protein